MARTGMSDLISQIRVYCNLGTSDYTLGTATHWSDDQIQTILDKYRTTVVEEELLSIENSVGGGSIQYKEFHSGYGKYEQTTGGSAIFIIQDSTGTSIGTSNWTMDYAQGILTFSADQQGSSRYITGRSYDLNNAAADIWKIKAGAYAEAVNFSTDNMRVDRSDLIKHCFDMSREFASKGQSKTIDMIRDDSE